jgi:putative hemolysin
MLVWEVLFVLFLIVINGFFAMSELAIVSARRARLQQITDGRHAKSARLAIALAEDPSKFLSTVQIGITLVGIFAGAYGGATLAEPLAEWLARFPLLAPFSGRMAFVLVVVAIGYLSLIIGELVPKRVALANPEGIAVSVAGSMRVLARVAGPLAWLLSLSSDALIRVLRLPTTQQHSVTEDEVKTLIKEGTQNGVFEPVERQMIEAVLQLSDRTVRSIMTPRPNVVWLDIDDPSDVIAREIRDSGSSRFPVCRGDLDEVQGFVSAKALLDQAVHERRFDLRAVLVPPLIVHDGTPVFRMLDLFRQATQHMAVVVDEYGSVEGIVTVTDILEGIAGTLPDAAEDAGAGTVQREDGSWLVDGMTSVEEVEDLLGIKGLRGDDYHTIAGFILHRLGHVPKAAEHFQWQGMRYEVVDMDGRRVDKILVQRVVPGAAREPG